MPRLSQADFAVMQRAMDHAIAFRQSIPDRPIPAQISAAEAMRRFAQPLGEHGKNAVEVIDDMVQNGDEGLTGFVSPGFFGYVTGASHPAGVAGDVLASSWGQITGYAAVTPTTVAMENTVCRWIIDMLNLPPSCGAGIVTGATLANTGAVIAARHELLRRAGWDVEAQGLFGAPEIQVVIGAEAHSATAAALRYSGLGAERVHRIATDDQGRMVVSEYERVMDGLNGPVLVILQAGHINSGAFDPFKALMPMAREKNAWVHVDGAFGLWLQAVPELADRLAGVTEADSWALDLHKWLNAPYDAGLVITRDRAPLVASMSAKGAYLPEAGEIWDPNDSTMELSRRARGVPSYAILQTLGQKGVRDMVTRHCALARHVAQALSGVEGLQVLNEVVCNQVAIRCGEGKDSDAMTRAFLKRVQEDGKVYPSHGHWKGGEIIRVSVSGHDMTLADADLLVSEITRAWQEVQKGWNGGS